MYLLEDPERKRKGVIKRKEDDHIAKDHLKGLQQILASVWENKKVVENVDNVKGCFYFNDVRADKNHDKVINKIHVILILVLFLIFTCFHIIILNES